MGATARLRVLLLSDTHGHLHPGIRDLAGRVDHVVHAGDIGHPDVLAALAAQSGEVAAVRGNNDIPDKWPLAGRTLLAGLPDCATLELPGGLLVVEHGDRVNPASHRHALLRERHPQARLIVYGHSHRQVIDDQARPWVVNPGAAGRSRTYGGAGCVLLIAGVRGWALEALRFEAPSPRPSPGGRG